jgi:hypothetical protein
MKTSEIISKLEQMGNFHDDPAVTVSYKLATGEIKTADIEHVGRLNADANLTITHQCEAVKPIEPQHFYYWNGKLLKDLSREELESTVVMLLNRGPERPEPKAAEKTPAVSVEKNA